VAGHVRRLKEAQRNLDQKSLKAAILEEESRRLQHLVRQLVEKRLEKIRATAGKTQAPVDTSEKWLLEEFTLINRHINKFKEDLAQGQEPSPSPEKRKTSLLIRFVKDVPSIIGVDFKTQGPFLKEDIASLPYENAESLIRQGAAVEVRTPLQENG
jgi:DNA replication factor GINS